LLFSDPWPKKAHHKHRVIQHDFLVTVAAILSQTGVFIIKTDDRMYSEWIHEHLEQSQLFDYTMEDEDLEKRSTPENSTEFETIWRRQGKQITIFSCKKR
jgi:tRNA (guanine-N7-)-methyltransferase